MSLKNITFSLIFIALISSAALATDASKPTIIYRVETSRKVVALTFDDGPDPQFTIEALNILEREGVRATFFDVGERALAHPDILLRELAGGHVVGSHTYSHVLLTRLTTSQALEEIQKGAEAIETIIDRKPLLFRPPWGKVQPDVLTKCSSDGFEVVAWTICLEHEALTTPKELADRVAARVRPGFIILTHDGTSQKATTRDMSIAALPLLIHGLKKQGYSFVTIPEILDMNKQTKVDPYALFKTRKKEASSDLMPVHYR